MDGITLHIAFELAMLVHARNGMINLGRFQQRHVILWASPYAPTEAL